MELVSQKCIIFFVLAASKILPLLQVCSFLHFAVPLSKAAASILPLLLSGCGSSQAAGVNFFPISKQQCSVIIILLNLHFNKLINRASIEACKGKLLHQVSPRERKHLCINTSRFDWSSIFPE